MSFHDQREFFKSIHPFDELSNESLESLYRVIEMAFYPLDTVLSICGGSMDKFYIIIKGEVKVLDENGDLIRIYREKDSFDADALLEGKCSYHYQVVEDLICYEIPKDNFLKLFESSEAFRRFYLMDIVERLEYLKGKSGDSVGDWMTAKVEDSYWHSPCIATMDMKLVDAMRCSVNMKRSEIIVESKDGSYGIVTDSDIKMMIVNGTFDTDTKVSDVAKYPMLCVERDDFLFNAYLTLIKENIKRLGVTQQGKLIGIIEQIDILSFLANHSHLITVKIEKANSIAELKEASLGYITIVKRLYRQGLKARYIAKLISEINRKLFLKLYLIVVPKELQHKAVLVVMGSEGRGEQIIRTDQDNALIVEDGMEPKVFEPYMQEFSKALSDFGYPPCPGNIMVTNSYWQKSKSEFKKEIDRWIDSPNEESFMYFSIFFDAKAVAGDLVLLEELHKYIYERFNSSDDIFMAFFAKLTLLFETPVGIWSTILHKDRDIDIKKAGIFPIVQGVRALALKYKVEVQSTIERIKELSQRNIIDEKFAKELVEAFDALSILRLGIQLESIESGKEPNNIIHSDKLSKIERDMLRDSLEIVDRFKRFISREFELDRLPS